MSEASTVALCRMSCPQNGQREWICGTASPLPPMVGPCFHHTFSAGLPQWPPSRFLGFSSLVIWSMSFPSSLVSCTKMIPNASKQRSFTTICLATCYRTNCALQKDSSPISDTCEYDLIWKLGLCRCDQLRSVHTGQ